MLSDSIIFTTTISSLQPKTKLSSKSVFGKKRRSLEGKSTLFGKTVKKESGVKASPTGTPSLLFGKTVKPEPVALSHAARATANQERQPTVATVQQEKNSPSKHSTTNPAVDSGIASLGGKQVSLS